jgi:hypothetical protein
VCSVADVATQNFTDTLVVSVLNPDGTVTQVEAMQVNSKYQVFAGLGDKIKSINSVYYKHSPECFTKPTITGIEEVIEGEVKLGPNPFSDVLNVALVAGRYEVSLTDMFGHTVRAFSATGNFSIERDDLKEGLYFLKITPDNGKNTITKKVQVQ